MEASSSVSEYAGGLCSSSATARDYAAADAALAKLVWLGYDHEQASEAIRLSGSVDPDFVSEYIIGQLASNSAMPEPITDNNRGSSTLRSSTTSRPPSRALRICEPEEALPMSMPPAHDSSPYDNGKGKSPMDEGVEDGELDTDRWNRSTADTALEILVEMGFTPEKVEEAIKAHGLLSKDYSRKLHFPDNLLVYYANKMHALCLHFVWCTGITENVVESVSSLATYIVTGLDALNLDEENWEDVMEQPTKNFGHAIIPERNFCHEDLEAFKQVTAMGFDPSKVSNAIDICGESATGDQIVEHIVENGDILALVANGSSEQLKIRPKEEEAEDDPIQNKFDQLLTMGYSYVDCRRAIDTYGQASMCELCDFLDALGEEDNLHNLEEDTLPRTGRSSSDSDDESDLIVETDKEGGYSTPARKRKYGTIRTLSRSKEKKYKTEGEETIATILRNRTGFGLPGQIVITRTLDPDVGRPPYFYFENVENMPSGEWRNIRRHLFNIEPELMDALNFSACRRPRGYIHNLPVEGRMDILPKPPMTIQELMGNAAKYQPTWDKRVKLNTICTRTATNFVFRQIKDNLKACEQRGFPTHQDIKNIMYWARKWNLVWVHPNKLAPLSPEEVERCLGFDLHHTRVLYSPVDRIKVLGNSFQVNTVAYHLSVLKARYPYGMRVLSLFSGIGGAEVALHKLGVFLKVVVSIEIDERARSVLDSWWKSTDQKGHLIHDYTDVRLLDTKVLMGLLQKYKGFDLVIGGSPCNNLSGNNRSSRVGLQGVESVAFFEFPRILNVVRDFMFSETTEEESLAYLDDW